MRLTKPVRSLRGFCLFASSIWAAGCTRVQDAAPITNEQYISVPNSVGFDIAPIEVEGPGSTFLATCSSNGKTARFRIELNPSKPLDDKESRIFSVESGKGRFVAEPGSEASALLLELKKALEARAVPSSVDRIAGLPFTYVSFGHNKSQASRGGFNDKPPGNWTPMKVFIGQGRHECDVFLNLNPVIKKGQFSIKDADYGDACIQQLAKVL